MWLSVFVSCLWSTVSKAVSSRSIRDAVIESQIKQGICLQACNSVLLGTLSDLFRMLSPSSVKQIPVRSSLQLQLLSRISQIWLPVDSKSTDRTLCVAVRAAGGAVSRAGDLMNCGTPDESLYWLYAGMWTQNF